METGTWQFQFYHSFTVERTLTIRDQSHWSLNAKQTDLPSEKIVNTFIFQSAMTDQWTFPKTLKHIISKMYTTISLSIEQRMLRTNAIMSTDDVYTKHQHQNSFIRRNQWVTFLDFTWTKSIRLIRFIYRNSFRPQKFSFMKMDEVMNLNLM